MFAGVPVRPDLHGGGAPPGPPCHEAGVIAAGLAEGELPDKVSLLFHHHSPLVSEPVHLESLFTFHPCHYHFTFTHSSQ